MGVDGDGKETAPTQTHSATGTGSTHGISPMGARLNRFRQNLPGRRSQQRRTHRSPSPHGIGRETAQTPRHAQAASPSPLGHGHVRGAGSEHRIPCPRAQGDIGEPQASCPAFPIPCVCKRWDVMPPSVSVDAEPPDARANGGRWAEAFRFAIADSLPRPARNAVHAVSPHALFDTRVIGKARMARKPNEAVSSHMRHARDGIA